MVFVCPGIGSEICLQSVLKYIMLEKNIKKIMISWNVCQTHILKVGFMKIMGDHETLSIVHHVELCVDFSSMKSSLGL